MPKIGVLITRPAHQAQNLADMIQSAGGQPVVYPTLIISPLPNPPPQGGSAREGAELADIVIFTSVNAVTLFDWMPAYAGMTAAIGAATAQALEARGIRVDYLPESNRYNSEGLLALLPEKVVKNKTIAIIKGRGGRQLLTQELTKRGAAVNEIDVYERTLPTDLPEINLDDIDVIISTSKESLENLVKLLDVCDKQLIVISARVADYAQQLGFIHPPIVAENASDAALVAAFINWRNKR